ncbi:hypothetical protein KP509_29G071100 [Ceratopteris richardii]|uniref:Acidic leucine-rich nuclear phosphoprotein 32-related protein n=1 Tax=Ceratopteris richardii TaxID=49495 RepID=A0A8T2R9M8_CERRI|nr:hypothetical protein KP509_29G071100 [Ceratopteris richardii]KAH7292491.1 hypothetical protein KP509_29G071100 [Ceratopteris richardii]KAH7292495.1 hypothetical protein KP509_29G071100 [Ceratopteris richardii]
MDEAWERAVEVACEGQKDPLAVRSLTLDGSVKCSQGRLPARSLLERFTQLRVLSIANVGLASLADFPSLKHLERLNLSDNRISGGLEFLVSAGLQSLRDIDLSNNKIQQFDDIAPLAQLNLLSLDLYECPITRLQGYRPKVFSMIKSLQYLDKVDAEDNERPESDEEEEEDVDDDEVDDDDSAGVRSNGFIDQDEDDGEDSEELDEEDDENIHYQAGSNHVGQNQGESGSEEEEIDDEEDTEQVLEVEESEDEEAGEDEEDVDDEDNEDEGTEEMNAAADGEIDAQDEGEDDNSELGDEDEDGDEGVDDEEVDEEDDEEDEEGDLGTEYLVRPIACPEDEEGASDFEPNEDEFAEDDEDIDDDDEEAEPAAAPLKRKRSKAEDDSRDASEERPPKK